MLGMLFLFQEAMTKPTTNCILAKIQVVLSGYILPFQSLWQEENMTLRFCNISISIGYMYAQCIIVHRETYD